jgi:hypothetical protein
MQRLEASKEVMDVMKALKESGAIKKWGSAADGTFARRTISLTDLKMVGVKAPDQIATPSTRNDLAFLVTVVGVSSVLAVAASFLPGAGFNSCFDMSAEYDSCRDNACVLKVQRAELWHSMDIIWNLSSLWTDMRVHPHDRPVCKGCSSSALQRKCTRF